MKAIILLLCLFICYNSNAQNCEFEVGAGYLNPKDANDYGSHINADNVKLIEDSNFFYILSVSHTLTPVYAFYLRLRKYSKCGNILLDEKQQTIREQPHYKIIITQGISSNWNICLKGDSTTIYEMDTNCNVRKLFFINENTFAINDFARVDSNQFVFVGHKNDKAIVFATDTLGNKIWQKMDTIVTSGNSYYNKIKKDITNQIYLLGSQNNRFTKTMINSDGLISKTIYYETGITQKLNRLNYELTFSNNMQFFYAFVLMNENQLISKYDSVDQIAYKVLMGKADSIINMKATSNGFSVITNGENYLIDSTLTPYFNQRYRYGYATGVSRSYISYTNYNTDLLLSNDSFIVSVQSLYMNALLEQSFGIKFYKAKISTSLHQPIMVDSGSVLYYYIYGQFVDSALNIAVLNSKAIHVGWWCNKKNIVTQKFMGKFNEDLDIYGCYLQHSTIKPDTVELCARNYFKSQFSVDVCKSFIFKQDAQTGIDNKIKESIQIYPNPANDFVEINTGGLKNVSIELYNLLGQEMPWQEVLQPGNGIRRLYFNKQTKGIYTIKINTDEGAVTQKILIAE